MNHTEDNIQSACIFWFSLQHSDISQLCFAVPNGGNRNIREAARLKKSGVRRGVADIILLIPKGTYASLCCEIKTPIGKQSPFQKSWQSLAEKHGNKYVIVRSFDEFRSEVESYLRQK